MVMLIIETCLNVLAHSEGNFGLGYACQAFMKAI